MTPRGLYARAASRLQTEQYTRTGTVFGRSVEKNVSDISHRRRRAPFFARVRHAVVRISRIDRVAENSFAARCATQLSRGRAPDVPPV